MVICPEWRMHRLRLEHAKKGPGPTTRRWADAFRGELALSEFCGSAEEAMLRQQFLEMDITESGSPSLEAPAIEDVFSLFRYPFPIKRKGRKQGDDGYAQSE